MLCQCRNKFTILCGNWWYNLNNEVCEYSLYFHLFGIRQLGQGANEDCRLFWRIMPIILAEPYHNHMAPVCPAKLLTVWWTNGVLVRAGVGSERVYKSVISHSKNMRSWSYISTLFLLHIISLWNALLHTVHCFTSWTVGTVWFLILDSVSVYCTGVLRKAVSIAGNTEQSALYYCL